MQRCIMQRCILGESNGATTPRVGERPPESACSTSQLDKHGTVAESGRPRKQQLFERCATASSFGRRFAQSGCLPYSSRTVLRVSTNQALAAVDEMASAILPSAPT